MRVNLNDNVSDHFEFTLGGVDFNLKYPTLEEIEPLRALYEERDQAQENKELLAEIDKKIEAMMYGFITPVSGNRKVEEVLKTQPFPVIKKFNQMIAEQFSVE